MKTTILSLIGVLLFFNLAAQKEPMKWGKIAKEDLAMTTYEADPDAEAVVLGEYGSLNFDMAQGDTKYKLYYHKRIKILKKSAFQRGDISIPYYYKDNYEKLGKVKAQVILPDGKKIPIKDFYEEKINDYYKAKKFASPNLEAGCIIEYMYQKTSKDYFTLEEWYFQEDIPVRFSEFRTEIPKWFHYVSFTQGEKANVESTQAFRKMLVPGVSYGISGVRERAAAQQIDAEMNRNVYKMENVPALKRENYITTMEDYYSKVQFQLQGVQFPNSLYEEVISNWDKLAKELLELESFGNQINKKRTHKKMWGAVSPKLEGVADDEEKIAILYRFIANSMKWDENYSYAAKGSINDAFEKGSANSAEFNLAMIALCRQAGIDAHPVLISTRSHGKMLPLYPKVSQFNHVLAQVNTGGKQFLFDVGSPMRAPELLRMSSLNYKGWLVMPDVNDWIDIKASSDKEVCMATFDLDAEGTLSGKIEMSCKGYKAMSDRSDHSKNPDHKHIKEEWSEKFADIKLDSILIENGAAIEKPFVNKIHCSIPEAAQVSGDFIYLSPVLDAWEENPLKLEKRIFPVDIPFGRSDQYILNLTIPEGYSIEELPESVNILLPEKGGKFQYFISQKENSIQLVSKISIRQLHYEPEQYDIIKNFFDLIVEKQGEQIVLKKKT